ncbi:MAG: hypothetical protein U5N56_00265 [Candidatus Marinimicrobia bacterium]|nr:hypothetical protein [Candidatus Neomarinimicrobiota bacterium]
MPQGKVCAGFSVILKVEQGEGLDRAAIDKFQGVGLSKVFIKVVKYVSVSYNCFVGLIARLSFDKTSRGKFNCVVGRVYSDFFRMHLQVIVICVKFPLISLGLLSGAMKYSLGPLTRLQICNTAAARRVVFLSEDMVLMKT